jgi:hypothetical protein
MSNLKLVDRPLYDPRDCLFNVFAAILYSRHLLYLQPENAPCRVDKGLA